MKQMEITSSVSFHYYTDFDKAKFFYETVLGLQIGHDFDWAILYQVTGKSFIGVVKKDKSSITQGHTRNLFSFTVSNLEECYDRIKHYENEFVFDLSEIKHFEDIQLKSFFFKCHEGYDFEIQSFQSEELKRIF